jgi:hypothetical protein
MAMPFLGDDADWSNPSEVCLELLVERGPSLAPDRKAVGGRSSGDAIDGLQGAPPR